MELITPGKQNIASQKSFGKFQTDLEPIAEALANYTARVTEKLRKQKCVAGGMEIWLGTNHFSKTDKQYSPEDIVRILNDDKEFNAGIKYIEKKIKSYTILWISVLGMIFIFIAFYFINEKMDELKNVMDNYPNL